LKQERHSIAQNDTELNDIEAEAQSTKGERGEASSSVKVKELFLSSDTIAG
jgi:hypothetical protein